MIAIELNTLDWTLIGILAALFIAQVYFYGRYMAAPARRLRRDKKKVPSNDQMVNTPGVSVILAAHNEGDNLANYLQALLTQEWPEYAVASDFCSLRRTRGFDEKTGSDAGGKGG